MTVEPRVWDIVDLGRAMEEREMRRVDRQRWGRWWLVRDNLTLEYRQSRRSGWLYYVDLERCRTSAQTLDWIAQINGKGWCRATDLAHLVRALDELLGLQENLCGCGRSAPAVNVAALLRKRGFVR